jgi:hypothetical protein
MTTSAYDVDDSLEELRCRLMWHLGLALIGFGILGAWYLLIRQDIPLVASGLLCLVIALGRITQIVMSKHPALASYLLVWGLRYSGIGNVDVPTLAAVSGLVCVFVSAMLINNGGVFTAASIVGSQSHSTLPPPLYPLLNR